MKKEMNEKIINIMNYYLDSWVEKDCYKNDYFFFLGNASS